MQRECDEIENVTRGQNCNKDWFIHRAGRITASNFYAVGTKIEKTFGVTI